MPTLSRRDFVLQSAAAGVVIPAAALETKQLRSTPGSGDALFAGAAVADITPATGIQMWGYSNPEQISTGTRDPLHARALVLRAGDATVGLLSLDLGRMPPKVVCQRIRDAVRAHGINEVIFCATHTHSGPLMELPELPHVQAMEGALVDVLIEAAGRLEPARIGVGTATLDIAHNRRVVVDGQCLMRWRNLDRLPSSPVDQELTAIQVVSAAGKPVASLVHYACHPVIFASDNTLYSADWCGAMCSRVEQTTGAPCLFLQGAAGDINPYFDKMSLAEGAVDAVSREGAKAADAVFEALKTPNWLDAPQASLAHARSLVEVGIRYDLGDATQRAILQAAYSRLYDVYIADLSDSLAVPVDTLVLQNALALTFHPGEPFVQFQLDFKTRSTVAHSLLCGYANDFHIYFPTIQAALIGGYGASSATYVGVGAGERLLAASQMQVGELTGKLGPLKGVEDLQSRDWTA